MTAEQEQKGRPALWIKSKESGACAAWLESNMPFEGSPHLPPPLAAMIKTMGEKYGLNEAWTVGYEVKGAYTRSVFFKCADGSFRDLLGNAAEIKTL